MVSFLILPAVSLLLLRASACSPPTSSVVPPPDAKWRTPCGSSASVRSFTRGHGLSADTHSDTYVWHLLQLATDLVPLLANLSACPRAINWRQFGADRVRQFDMPGMAPPSAASGPPASSEGLTSAQLQRFDQEMARAAVYLQLYRRFARLHDRTSAQRQILDRCLTLVYRSQCRVQLLHGVLFGRRRWATRRLTVASVVPLRWRDPSAPQSVKHLRHLVTVSSVKRLFSKYRRTFSALRNKQLAA